MAPENYFADDEHAECRYEIERLTAELKQLAVAHVDLGIISTQQKPEPYVTVLITGGLASWTGKEWITLFESRPLTWTPQWWMPIPKALRLTFPEV